MKIHALNILWPTKAKFTVFNYDITWSFSIVSYACYNILPQTLWLNTIQIYSLTVLESRSPKSVSFDWNQDVYWHFFGGTKGKFVSSPLPASRVEFLDLTHRHFIHLQGSVKSFFSNSASLCFLHMAFL